MKRPVNCGLKSGMFPHWECTMFDGMAHFAVTDMREAKNRNADGFDWKATVWLADPNKEMPARGFTGYFESMDSAAEGLGRFAKRL